MRSSLLIDLSQGKRIEVEALQGSVVRRAARAGVPVADYVDAVCGAETVGGRGTPIRVSKRLEIPPIADGGKRRLDSEEDDTALLAVDERGEVLHRLVAAIEARQHGGIVVVNQRLDVC